MKSIAILICLSCITLSYAQLTDSLIDSRDGKIYKIIKLGNKTWMAENLNYETPESYCYLNDPDFCNIYGRLYTWEAALKACPKGWKLPTHSNWDLLVQSHGGLQSAGAQLRKDGDSGFNAQLGGYLYSGGSFHYAGQVGGYWSSTKAKHNKAWRWRFYASLDEVHLFEGNKKGARSVRCIQE